VEGRGVDRLFPCVVWGLATLSVRLQLHLSRLLRRYRIAIVLALLVTMVVSGGLLYGSMDDPPLWPRGESFCDPAAVTQLMDVDAYAGWEWGTPSPTMERDGLTYFHPVGAAQAALAALQAGDRQTAVELADRLDREGLAYEFRWEWPPGEMIEPPWYSAMAQGQALSVYARLNDERAHDAYRSLITMQRDDGWLPEMPVGPDILNGHIFAAMGLHDYWRMTGEDEAALPALRVLTDRLNEFRRVGRTSRYAGSQPAPPKYHAIHVRQLHQLAAVTGMECFVEAADAWDRDA
jgi:hypothetical protein